MRSAHWMVNAYGTWRDAPSTERRCSASIPAFNQDHIVEEDTDSAYFQYG